MCIPEIVFGYSKDFRPNWRLKVHYISISCSRRGALRHVCGHTNHRTTMVDTFLESPSDLVVHPGKRFALFGQNRRNWRRRSRHPKRRNLLHVARTDEVRVPLMTIFFLALFNFFVCKALLFASCVQFPSNREKLTYKSKISRLSLLKHSVI